jgi:hypothetical protein
MYESKGDPNILDVEKLKGYAQEQGIVDAAPAIILESCFHYLITEGDDKGDIRAKMEEFTEIVRYFSYEAEDIEAGLVQDLVPIHPGNEKMLQLLEQKLVELVTADDKIQPKDVPSVLLQFKVADIITHTQYYIILREILRNKMLDFAFPFADYIMRNWSEWKREHKHVVLKEHDYIMESYPEIFKGVSSDETSDV